MKPNECICVNGWAGANCTECRAQPNCPGTCDVPHGCVCQDGKLDGLCTIGNSPPNLSGSKSIGSRMRAHCRQPSLLVKFGMNKPSTTADQRLIFGPTSGRVLPISKTTALHTITTTSTTAIKTSSIPETSSISIYEKEKSIIVTSKPTTSSISTNYTAFFTHTTSELEISPSPTSIAISSGYISSHPKVPVNMTTHPTDTEAIYSSTTANSIFFLNNTIDELIRQLPFWPTLHPIPVNTVKEIIEGNDILKYNVLDNIKEKSMLQLSLIN